MIEVRKKKGESFESMIRRFNKRVQQSGRIYEVRDIRFFNSPKSKNKQRQDAIRRSQIRNTKEYERKIGKLKDEYEHKKSYR